MKYLHSIILLVLFYYSTATAQVTVFKDLKANKLNVDNIQLDGSTVSTTNTNGDLTFDLNGTGSIILTDLTASRVPYLDGSKKIVSSSVSGTELELLTGLSGAILTQTNTVTGITNKTFTSPGLTTPSTDIITFDDQGSTPSNPAAGFYKLYFKTDGTAYSLDSAGNENELGGGGAGGGAALLWSEQDSAPIKVQENQTEVYEFADGEAQYLYTVVKVPAGYDVGNPISLKGVFYTSVTSGTALFQTLATLNRVATDAISSTTNQRTSTNSAVTVAGSTNVTTTFTVDLTSATGQINGVSVSPGDIIKVRITRDVANDTAAAALKFLGDFSEVTYE